MQWFALFISIVGVAIVQYEQHRTSVSLHHRSTESANAVIGFVAVIAMCWTSAIAGCLTYQFNNIVKPRTFTLIIAFQVYISKKFSRQATLIYGYKIFD